MFMFDFNRLREIWKGISPQLSRFTLIVYTGFMIFCAFLSVGSTSCEPIGRDAPLSILEFVAFTALLGYWVGATRNK